MLILIGLSFTCVGCRVETQVSRNAVKPSFNLYSSLFIIEYLYCLEKCLNNFICDLRTKLGSEWAVGSYFCYRERAIQAGIQENLIL
jgi:hypothetical protein